MDTKHNASKRKTILSHILDGGHMYQTIIVLCSLLFVNCADKRSLDSRRGNNGMFAGPATPNEKERDEKLEALDAITKLLDSGDGKEFKDFHEQSKIFFDSTANRNWPDTIVYSFSEFKSALGNPSGSKIVLRASILIVEPLEVSGTRIIEGSSIKFESEGALVFNSKKSDAKIVSGPDDRMTAAKGTCSGLTKNGPIQNSLVIKSKLEGTPKFVFNGSDNYLAFENPKIYNRYRYGYPPKKDYPIEDPMGLNAQILLNADFNVIAFSGILGDLAIGGKGAAHLVADFSSLDVKSFDPNEKSEDFFKRIFVFIRSFWTDHYLGLNKQFCYGPSAYLTYLYSMSTRDKTIFEDNVLVKEIRAHKNSCWKDQKWIEKANSWAYCR